MNEDGAESREQKRTRQTYESHAALGRYVEAYEQLIMCIRGGCSLLTCLLTPGRTGVKQQQLMNVVFYHHSMTADNLFSIYRALVGQIINDSDMAIDPNEANAIRGILKCFDSAFQKTIAMRNNYLHGTLFIGHGNTETEDWSEIGFLRGKSTKEGLLFVDGPKDAGAIDAAARECKRLHDYFLRFSGCFQLSLSGRDVRVSKNFIQVDKDWRPKD